MAMHKVIYAPSQESIRNGSFILCFAYAKRPPVLTRYTNGDRIGFAPLIPVGWNAYAWAEVRKLIPRTML